MDVRGQLHYPNGSVIKANWIIAGGEDAQHSASVSHIKGSFLVSYADEAPPAQYAMVKTRFINEQNGNLQETFALSAPDADNWYPVSASNGQTRAFVGWGDGDAFSGVILAADGGTFSRTPARVYIAGIEQYHYHVAWIAALSRFIIVAKTGESAAACLVDLDGRAAPCVRGLPPLVREANIAVSDALIAYPTGARDLAFLRATTQTIRHTLTWPGNIHPQLKTITWPSTGVWGRFAPETGDAEDQQMLWAMNNKDSNEAIFLSLDTGFAWYPLYLPLVLK